MRTLTLLLLTILLSGCSHQVAHYKILSNYIPPEMEARFKQRGKNKIVYAEDCAFYTFASQIAVASSYSESLDRAVNTQILAKDIDIEFLKDLEIDRKSVTILFHNEYCFYVRGKPMTLR